FLRNAAEETERIWVEVLERGMETGVFRADVEARMVYRFMRDAIWVSVRWYRPDRRYRPDEIADFYLATLLEGIAQSSSSNAALPPPSRASSSAGVPTKSASIPLREWSDVESGACLVTGPHRLRDAHAPMSAEITRMAVLLRPRYRTKRALGTREDHVSMTETGPS